MAGAGVHRALTGDMVDPSRLPSHLTTAQVAEVTGTPRKTVNNWCISGKIGAFKTPGGYYRIPTAPLVAMYEAILQRREGID